MPALRCSICGINYPRGTGKCLVCGEATHPFSNAMPDEDWKEKVQERLDKHNENRLRDLDVPIRARDGQLFISVSDVYHAGSKLMLKPDTLIEIGGKQYVVYGQIRSTGEYWIVPSYDTESLP